MKKAVEIRKYWLWGMVWPITIGLTLGTLLIVFLSFKLMHNLEQRHIDAVAETTANLLSEPISIGDSVEVTRRSTLVANQHGFLISVFDTSGEQIATSGNALREKLVFSLEKTIVASDGRACGKIRVAYNLRLISVGMAALIVSTIVGALIFVWLLALKSGYPIVRDILKLNESFQKYSKDQPQFRFLEIQNSYINHCRQAERLAAAEFDRARADLAGQVSHDIRSPLSALNMILASLQDLPEDRRLIVRNATQRINDIANSLLQKSRATQNSETNKKAISRDEPIMLVALLDAIVSEKRVQFRDTMNIEIQGELRLGYGLFAKIDASLFARTISNLVNNSIEAFSSGGRIDIGIGELDGSISVTIKDNGKGIPEEVLKRIGEQGVSFGKVDSQSGFGLGVYHAQRTIESAGGHFTVTSQVGIGTVVTMRLPKATTPDWFLEKLEIQPNSFLVSADDDHTIHQIWDGRLSSVDARSSGIEHLTFSSLEQFENWLLENSTSVSSFLVDYEFLGQIGTGLDVIERTGINRKAILVTSRYDEPYVRDRAELLGVKVLPKALAPFVPLSIGKSLLKFDAVLIDDDVELIHTMWKMAAQEQGKQILCFSRVEDFYKRAVELDKSTPLYIDVNLGAGIRGETVAAGAVSMGFTNVVLATGYENDSVSMPIGVHRVIGKDPVF